MLNPLRTDGHPRLLVSVRNDEEALEALTGGADVIDVKEPARGSLGAADYETIAAVVHAVGGRAPVSAALGELVEFLDRRERRLQTSIIGVGDDSHISFVSLPAGVVYFKIGLSQCGPLADWSAQWRDVIAMLRGNSAPVAVAYADWRAARAPNPEDVLTAALSLDCPAVLIDTWNKAAGALFDHWPADSLRVFIDRAHSHQLAVVLAGSLTETALPMAAGLRPDLIAVRGAACEGGRDGRVSRSRVEALRLVLEGQM